MKKREKLREIKQTKKAIKELKRIEQYARSKGNEELIIKSREVRLNANIKIMFFNKNE